MKFFTLLLFMLAFMVFGAAAIDARMQQPSTMAPDAVSPDAEPPAADPIKQWLTENAIPLASMTTDTSVVSIFNSVRVVGLGEATHGQRECFAFKRRLTMHLIREHGFRLVAYEANATAAQALNDYVQGHSDDVAASMGGFGMMIWMVEENQSLLNELRQWNRQAEAKDQVEIIGVDVQAANEAGRHLNKLLGDALPELASEARAIADDLVAARNAAYGGDTSGIKPAQDRLATFTTQLSQSWGKLALRTSRANADEAMRCARELARFPVDPSDRAMRDRGMSQTLLEALALRPAGTKAVLWCHNGHITKGPMRWMGTTDPGCGGYLRATLGDEYYALGVAFGSGDFQALHRDKETKWWFRRYQHGPPPTDTVAHTLLAAGLSNSLIDFRKAPADGPVRAWLDGDIGIRSWGGHNVPDDPDAAVEQGLGLAWTILSADYDGLLFLKHTTSAEPVDQGRIWK